ncbi:MAG: hypothetical protein R6X02_06715, partial [Enhygromyxa sp.]
MLLSGPTILIAFVLVSWALPGLARAADPASSGSDAASRPEVPGARLSALAGKARVICEAVGSKEGDESEEVKKIGNECQKLPKDWFDLEDPSLAAVAVLVVPGEARRVENSLERIVVSAEETPPLVEQPEKALPEALTAAKLGLGLGSGSMADLASGIAAALTKFVQERAKREALSWVLDQMARDLCVDDKRWFPHLCALAKDDRLGSYAADSALLEALQGALLEDTRSWPGTMIEATVNKNYEEESQSAKKLKTATKHAFGRIARGNNPAHALHELGSELAGALPVHGCALALPAAFIAYRELLDGLLTPEPAAQLAALLGTPECNEITGDITLDNLIQVWQEHGKTMLRHTKVTGAALYAAQSEYDTAMAEQPTGSGAQGQAGDKQEGEK